MLRIPIPALVYRSRSLCLPVLLTLVVAWATHQVHADTKPEPKSWRVFAPSRKSESLLIVRAAESTPGKLTLKLEKRVPLGFTAATITSHPTKPWLYVASNRSKDGKADGVMIKLNADGSYNSKHPASLAHGYSYLSVDRSGKYLFGCSYGGGQIDVYTLNKDGSIGENVWGLNEWRKAAHCVLVSPDNRFVYIPYVKDNNALYQYRFDPNSGSLHALKPKNALPPDGTGPRHMAYHPSKPIAYFSNEQHIGVSVYEMQDTGQLKLRQVCDAVKPTFEKKGVSSSDIVITPDGKFLFAGIRGHSQEVDAVSRYRIKEDGTVEHLGMTKADKIPWGFTLSPDGKYVLVTGFKAGTLTAFAIDNKGDLKRAASLGWDMQISDVVAR